MFQYKGYTGIAEVDDEAGVISGTVVGLRDVITFQAETVTMLRKSFEDSIDDYLEFCAGRGEEPEKPFSGKFLVRVKPALHRALAHTAEIRKMSLNSLVEQALEAMFLDRGSHPALRTSKPKAKGKAKAG